MNTAAHMPEWNDAQIRRFNFRLGLFQRRGLTHDAAERWGDRLAVRDHERDDRRICLECSSLQRGGKCFAVQQGRMKGVSSKHEPVTNVLQRCDHFEFQTP